MLTTLDILPKIQDSDNWSLLESEISKGGKHRQQVKVVNIVKKSYLFLNFTRETSADITYWDQYIAFVNLHKNFNVYTSIGKL